MNLSIANQVINTINDTIQDSKLSDIQPDDDLREIGMDSIAFIKIVVALEIKFDFEFDDEMLLIATFPTIKSMIEYVELKIQ